MAAVKKRKARVKAKKAPAKKKSPVRKKKALKKSPARKPAAKRAAPKKKAAARAPARPRPAPAPVPRGPLPGEVRVGVVSHYYGHLSVAAVKLEVALKAGDTIRVLGHTSDFRQKVDSIQIEHQAVSEAIAGDEIGLKVVQHAREHDVVYRVPS
jgi:putative protease